MKTKQLSLEESCNMIKVDMCGLWIGITDEEGRHDVCVKKCVLDRTQRKVIITGHNRVWVVEPSQIDLTH